MDLLKAESPAVVGATRGARDSDSSQAIRNPDTANPLHSASVSCAPCNSDGRQQLNAGGRDPHLQPVVPESCVPQHGIASRLNPVRASALAHLPVPTRRWHVDGLIPARTVTLLSGDGSAGKTLLVLQLGAATVTGTSWIGQLPKKGPVVFYTAEDELDEIHIRLHDVVRGQGLRLEDLGDLHIISMAHTDALLSVPQGDAMQSTALFQQLRAEVLAIKPALVVIDPLADVFGGDEIKKVHARQFIASLRALAIEADTSVLLLSHPSQAGMASGEGTSGNVAWSNSVRSRLYLEKPKAERTEQQDHDARMLSVRKSNYGPAGRMIMLRWREGSYVLDGPGSSGGTRKDDDVEQLFIDLLREFGRAGRSVTDKACATYAPKLFTDHPAAKGVRKADFVAAMTRLFAKRRIKIVTEGSPSRQRSRIVEVDRAES